MADKMIRHYGVSALAIAHCNFHLRGDESDADAAFVRDFAAAAGVKLHMADFDTAAFATEHGVSIEMAARELRYRWFDSLCREYGYEAVCVAHNANDNAETLLLNLVRGTGLRGLCGMAEESRNPYGDSLVRRPMLGWSRARIEEYAASHGLAYRTDSSNLSSEYKRNLIRNEVMPLLQKLNPSLLDTLTRDIANFRQAASIVDDWAAAAGAGLVQNYGGADSISIPALKSLPHWEYLLYNELSRRGFSSTLIDELERLLKDEDATLSGHRFDGSDCVLVTTSNELVISPLCGSESALAQLPTPVVELIDWHPGMNPRTERGVLLVDADRLGAEPSFRRWQDGDWLRPLGLGGKKKVSDFLTDLKYNILQKDSALVLEGSGSHVLAVVGERIDESLKISDSTSRVYRISIS